MSVTLFQEVQLRRGFCGPPCTPHIQRAGPGKTPSCPPPLPCPAVGAAARSICLLGPCQHEVWVRREGLSRAGGEGLRLNPGPPHPTPPASGSGGPNLTPSALFTHLFFPSSLVCPSVPVPPAPAGLVLPQGLRDSSGQVGRRLPSLLRGPQGWERREPHPAWENMPSEAPPHLSPRSKDTALRGREDAETP